MNHYSHGSSIGYGSAYSMASNPGIRIIINHSFSILETWQMVCNARSDRMANLLSSAEGQCL